MNSEHTRVISGSAFGKEQHDVIAAVLTGLKCHLPFVVLESETCKTHVSSFFEYCPSLWDAIQILGASRSVAGGGNCEPDGALVDRLWQKGQLWEVSPVLRGPSKRWVAQTSEEQDLQSWVLSNRKVELQESVRLWNAVSFWQVRLLLFRYWLWI